MRELHTALGDDGAPRLEVVHLDLADLASVQRAAAIVLGRHRALHLLINNAGAERAGSGGARLRG